MKPQGTAKLIRDFCQSDAISLYFTLFKKGELSELDAKSLIASWLVAYNATNKEKDSE